MSTASFWLREGEESEALGAKQNFQTSALSFYVLGSHGLARHLLDSACAICPLVNVVWKDPIT